MKNLLLTFGLFLCSNINAMHKTENQEKISAILFTVDTEPPVQIVQVPSRKKVKFDDQIGQQIKITGKNYNGMSIFSSVYISSDTPANVIVDFLRKFYDVKTVEYQKCSMSLDTYHELFPTVPSVTKKWSKVFWEKIISAVSFFDD